MPRKITNSGSTTAAIGAMRVEMIQNETWSLPRKLAAREPVAGQAAEPDRDQRRDARGDDELTE